VGRVESKDDGDWVQRCMLVETDGTSLSVCSRKPG